jgi:hypothetical protein
MCFEDFTSDASDEEAQAEADRNFGPGKPGDKYAIICDVCHESFWEYAAIKCPELKRVKREDLS